MIDARTALDQMIRDRGEDYASISKLIGRNAAYIQQFIRRGVPRKLDEDDRRRIASYLGMDETLLGAPAEARGAKGQEDGLIVVPQLAVGASAGPGAHNGEEALAGMIAFDPRWLRRLGANPRGLSMIRVQGESMLPTLNDGDDIMVDRTDGADRLRDGVYVMRVEESLLVKRLAFDPASRQYRIRSDNPAWPDWTDCDPAQVIIVGRVVWAGRSLR